MHSLRTSGAKSPVIAIAAGGTAGHRFIGQAIGEAYEARLPGLGIRFVTSREDLFSTDCIPAWPHFLVPSAPLTGQKFSTQLRSLWKLAGGFRYSRRLLVREGVDLVIGCGSYASTSILLAARSLGLPTVIHEANRVPGRANRLLGHLADLTLVSWEGMESRLPNARVVGTPIRRSLAAAGREAGERRGVRPDSAPVRLLVLGGSLGSRFFNSRLPPLAAALAKRGLEFQVVHQCGHHDAGAIREAYARHGCGSARVEPFFSDLATLYRESDLALSSGGAASLTELAAFSLPTLIVPLRNSADGHQEANVRAFAELTASPWWREDAWNASEVAETILDLVRDEKTWLSRSRRIHGAWIDDSSEQIVEHCEALRAGQSPPD